MPGFRKKPKKAGPVRYQFKILKQKSTARHYKIIGKRGMADSLLALFGRKSR